MDSNHFRIAGPVFIGLHTVIEAPHFLAADVRTCSIKTLVGKNHMSAQPLPSTARALAVIVAIALVATAMAPLILTAVRVVA